MAEMKIPPLKKKNRTLEEIGEESLAYALNWDKFVGRSTKKERDLAADLLALESQIQIAETYRDRQALPELRRQLKELEADIIEAEARGKIISEIRTGIAVYKDYKGADRWVTLSSNAFRDRDKEIVSTKALETDVDLSDKQRNYGPLRWWHTPGADLGPCDFRMMKDRVLIESGTFNSPKIAASIKAWAPKLQVSIGFTHPASEPDREGVYHNIRVFERSLVPAGRAANPWTIFSVKGENESMATLTEKMSMLKEILGDDQLAEQILSAADGTQKSASDSGADFKEFETYKAPAKALDEPEPAAEAAAETEADEAAEMATEPATAVDVEDDESEDVYVSELTVPEFASMLAEALDEVFGPYLAKMGPAPAAQAAAPAVKKEFDQLDKIAAGLAAMAGRMSDLETENARLKERVEKFEALPRSVKREFIASKDDSTVVPENSPLRRMAPGPDPLTDFTNFVIGNPK